MRSAELVLVVGLTGACAPSLSTFQPAHVPPKGHVMAAAALEVDVPVGGFTSLFDAGKTIAERGQQQGTLTTQEIWQVFDAGVNLALNFPSVAPHFALAFTPIDRLEVGVRYTLSAWRLGVRYQLLDRNTGPFDMTVGIGASRFSYEFPLSDQIPGLELQDFVRWQGDASLLIGTSRDWFRVWVGPRFMATTFETDLQLTLGNDVTLASFDGKSMYVGGQGGLALGYRKLFLAVELTLVEAIGTAHLSAPSLDPSTHDTDLGGFIVFPTFGLLGEF
jgi:hypothetical protein